jgi:hypothetical protein
VAARAQATSHLPSIIVCLAAITNTCMCTIYTLMLLSTRDDDDDAGRGDLKNSAHTHTHFQKLEKKLTHPLRPAAHYSSQARALWLCATIGDKHKHKQRLVPMLQTNPKCQATISASSRIAKRARTHSQSSYTALRACSVFALCTCTVVVLVGSPLAAAASAMMRASP